MARSQLDRFVLDANVLIDYCNVDKAILTLVSREVATIYLPLPLLDEVDQLDEAECGSLGIQVVVPTIEHLTEASVRRGRLSFEDRLCLVMARDSAWTCVTSDRRLRRECEAEGVRVLWGLELLLLLADVDALSDADALQLAEAIRETNHFMTEKIMQAFRDDLRKQRQIKESNNGET